MELDAEGVPLRLDPLDVGLGLLAGLGVPIAAERFDDRPAPVQVELPDLVGAAEVQVDGARMDGREGASTTVTESAEAERRLIPPAGYSEPRTASSPPRPFRR